MSDTEERIRAFARWSVSDDQMCASYDEMCASYDDMFDPNCV